MFEKTYTTPSCETCPIADLKGTTKRSPASVAAELAMYLWRRDFSNGDGVDDIGERQSIEEKGVKPEDVEFVYKCMLSRYRGGCNPTSN